MSLPALLPAFQLVYQVSPIVLIGGVAGQIAGGMLPIGTFTLAGGLGAVLSGASSNPLDDLVQFLPLAGSTLIDQELGEYPFANQQTAANAVITRPLTISYRMLAPASGTLGFLAKTALFQSLAQTLKQHNLLGGLYGCATPAYYWDSCVMRSMRDVTPEGSSTQRQVVWQLDFEQPLVTQAQAAAANNVLLSKISSGTQLTPDGTGAINATGAAQSGAPAGAGPTVTPSPSISDPGFGGPSPSQGFSDGGPSSSFGGFGSLDTP